MLAVVIMLLVIFALLESVYIYKLIMRAIKEFKPCAQKSRIRYIVRAISILLGIIGINIFGITAVIILHILAISAVTEIINLIIKKHISNPWIWNRIYALCIIPVVLTAGVMAYGYMNFHAVQKTEYTIYTQKNIRPDGYKIALLADVHYGVSLTGEEFLKQCEKISRENVDMVILCGDIVDDDTTKAQMQECFYALSTIENELGIFYVYGNHDRQNYSRNRLYSEKELIGAIEKNNITILCDDAKAIANDFVIVGREDSSVSYASEKEGRKSIEKLLRNVDKEKFILTLDHQPREYPENAKAGSDLILSGHTHGGQLWPVNILDNIFKFNEVNYGEVNIDKDTKAIVTSGFAGWNYPMKTAAPSEYVIVNIKKSRNGVFK